jgi:ring-opening amidohydrolase-like protein
MSVDVLPFDIAAPDDLAALAEAVDTIGTDSIVRMALFLRVPGEYEDGSREAARAALEAFLVARALSERCEYITVIGTEGVTSACGYALIETASSPDGSQARRLAIGLARSGPPEEASIGTMGFAHEAAEVVRRAMLDGGLAPSDVETVIVNVPQATSGHVPTRARRGRAAAALGAGVAIGAVDAHSVTDARIVDDAGLFAPRVQTYTGPAIENIEVIVIGNKAGAGGNLVACSTITQDLIDGRSIKRMLMRVGFTLDADGEIEPGDRLVATIAKLGAAPDGRVRGAPTAIYTSATPPEKHLRAAMSGVLAATLHTTRIFSTVDPVQQAPLGGGTICCIVRAAD